MSAYLEYCSGSSGAVYKLMWKLVSFLALDTEDQRALIGPTEQWFVKEDPRINPGANYLCGIILLIEDYGGGHHFDHFAPDEVTKMSELIGDMAWNRSKFRWSFDALEKDKRWLELRGLARTILEKTGLSINPPKKPIWFPDEMEIWWKNYKQYDEMAGKRR